MMREALHISGLLLERYNLGEVTGEEKTLVEAALAEDPVLAERLAKLRRSDAEIRSRDFVSGRHFMRAGRTRPLKRALRPILWSLGAAALVLFIALPFFGLGFFSSGSGRFDDRIKGSAGTTELRVYLKTGSETAALADQAILREGNTVQLAYTVDDQPDTRCYGVIFSIDGRSAVTLHYPPVLGADTRLVTGKWTLLEEAYTLDDAPDYEVFFFVVGGEPLDVPVILNSARQFAGQLAGQFAGNPETALQQTPSVFKNYEVKTVNLRKE
ncbi:MAG: hypothetical protein LBK63_03685 [Treponema sp.]|jgi:hypothetical protein|nr:hypothetical protein [Treponema sp.]